MRVEVFQKIKPNIPAIIATAISFIMLIGIIYTTLLNNGDIKPLTFSWLDKKNNISVVKNTEIITIGQAAVMALRVVEKDC